MKTLEHSERHMHILIPLDCVSDSPDHVSNFYKFLLEIRVFQKERLCFLVELVFIIVHLRILRHFQLLAQVFADCLKEYKPILIDKRFHLLYKVL